MKNENYKLEKLKAEQKAKSKKMIYLALMSKIPEISKIKLL